METKNIALVIIRSKNQKGLILTKQRGAYVGLPEAEFIPGEHVCDCLERAIKHISFPSPIISAKDRMYAHIGDIYDSTWDSEPATLGFYEVLWDVVAPARMDSFFVDPDAKDQNFDITLSMFQRLDNGPKKIEMCA